MASVEKAVPVVLLSPFREKDIIKILFIGAYRKRVHFF